MGLNEVSALLVVKANQDSKGATVKGKAAKNAARDLVQRGLASLNESETKMTLTPAGRWAFSQSR